LSNHECREFPCFAMDDTGNKGLMMVFIIRLLTNTC